MLRVVLLSGELEENNELTFFRLQGEKARQKRKSVTFQLPSENKHVLALDFLSWIMVRMANIL